MKPTQSNNKLGSKLPSTTSTTTKALVPTKPSSVITTKSTSTLTKAPLKDQTKPISSIKAPKEEKKEQGQVAVIPTTLNIKTQLLKSRDLAKKIKEIEDINKQKAAFLNWEIITSFENDSDLSNLVFAIEKVGPRVKHIKWEIRGSLSDTVGKTLGECLSKFPQLETLNLLVSTTFGDRFATALAITLKKLANLRILKVDVYTSTGEVTEKGNSKLNEAINSLTKLEFMSYSGYNWEEYSNLQSKISNHVYVIGGFEAEDLKGMVKENQQIFEKQLNPLKDRIIDLQVKYECYDPNGAECFNSFFDDMSQPLFYDIYTSLFNQIIELPYLTKLDKVCILNEEDEDYFNNFNSESAKGKKQLKLESVVQELLKQKYLTLLKFSVFANNLNKFFSFNPALILSDLYFN